MKAFRGGLKDLSHVAPSSLLHRLGGAAAVKATVDLFYDKVVHDSFLTTFFEQVNLARLKIHQTQFFVLAFGNLLPNELDHLQVNSYLIKHHQRLFQMGLNETHFDRVAGHLVAALHELQVKPTLIDEVVSVLSPLRAAFQEGASTFGVGDSPRENQPARVEADDDEDENESDFTQSRQEFSNQVVQVLKDFNCRVSTDPKLHPFWNVMDKISIDQQQCIFLELLMDSSKTKEVVHETKMLEQLGNIPDWEEGHVDLVASHFIAALHNLDEPEQAAWIQDAVAIVSYLRKLVVSLRQVT